MDRFRRRTALGLLVGGASAAALGPLDPVFGGRPGDSPNRLPIPPVSPVERENRALGEPWWPEDDGRAADDRRRQIQGYASTTSVAPGEEIEFHVAVNPAGRFRISVHRLGWYGGAGARTMLTSPELRGVPHPRARGRVTHAFALPRRRRCRRDPAAALASPPAHERVPPYGAAPVCGVSIRFSTG